MTHLNRGHPGGSEQPGIQGGVPATAGTGRYEGHFHPEPSCDSTQECRAFPPVSEGSSEGRLHPSGHKQPCVRSPGAGTTRSEVPMPCEECSGEFGFGA